MSTVNDYYIRYHGYTHVTVNHSKWFKDPKTGSHTNTIEGTWAHAKRQLILGGTRKKDLFSYLASFMLRRHLQGEDPFVEFVQRANALVAEGLVMGNHSLYLPAPLPPHTHAAETDSSDEDEDENDDSLDEDDLDDDESDCCHFSASHSEASHSEASYSEASHSEAIIRWWQS